MSSRAETRESSLVAEIPRVLRALPGVVVRKRHGSAWDIAGDPRFRNTWFRQRHDLNDQSQSGYDLALACFGIDAGLSEQQIVDLITHHRALHKQKHRTRLDYYQCTIAKALERSDAANAPATDTPLKQAEQRLIDPMAAKTALCEQISQVLGVHILRVVKITGKEPTYQMELGNAAKIEFTSFGMTRARETLYICDKASAMGVNL